MCRKNFAKKVQEVGGQRIVKLSELIEELGDIELIITEINYTREMTQKHSMSNTLRYSKPTEPREPIKLRMEVDNLQIEAVQCS